MKRFLEWFVEREIRDFNVIIAETRLLAEANGSTATRLEPIPNFKIAKKISVDASRYEDIQIRDIYDHARVQYLKELREKMQKEQRGISSPDRHFANCLRHQLTNYDAVWQALNEHFQAGRIDICKKLRLYNRLCKQVIETNQTMLSNMPNSFRLPNEEDVTYSLDIERIVSRTMNEKIEQNKVIMKNRNCPETDDIQAPDILSTKQEEQPVRQAPLQKSALEIAIEKALGGEKARMTLTGNKNAIASKLKEINRKANLAGLKTSFDPKINQVEISL